MNDTNLIALGFGIGYVFGGATIYFGAGELGSGIMHMISAVCGFCVAAGVLK